jgi:RimJ/RimL family protein N-acetyltransferase
MAATPAFRLETPRLLLREFGLADAAALFALNNDPEVLRYTATCPLPA